MLLKCFAFAGVGLDFGEDKVSYLGVDAFQKFLGDAVEALGGAVGGGEMESQLAAGFGVDVVHWKFLIFESLLYELLSLLWRKGANSFHLASLSLTKSPAPYRCITIGFVSAAAVVEIHEILKARRGLVLS